jgi:uncharacterized RDD family membrane protein YckC
MENDSPPPLPLDPATPPPPPRSPIAGFWRRALAACIDFVLLGVVGWVLGLFFAEQFMHMGGWGRLLGFAIALLYFVPLNSRIGGGQTLGKRALRIRVSTASGDLLSLPRSFARSFVVMLPFFLNGAPLPLGLLESPLGIVDAVAIFGLGFSIVYLIVFNRRTRQSLHDLAVGSYVLHAGAEQGEKPEMWKGHYVVVGFILLLTAIAPLVGVRLARLAMFANLRTAYDAIYREPEVTGAQVIAGNSYFWDSTNGKRKVSGITASIQLNRRIPDKAAEAEKFARIVLQTYPEASEKDSINIALNEGYDIGIASWFVNEGFNYSPAQWREKIDASASASKPPTTPAPK